MLGHPIPSAEAAEALQPSAPPPARPPAPFFAPSAPAELTVQILAECDSFADLIALVSTCRHLYQVWLANKGPIIWSVGRRVVPAFEEALVAVRATEIVKTALAEGLMPPTIAPQRLHGLARRPGLDELRQVLLFQHLARCLEQLYRKGVQFPRTWETLNMHNGREGKTPKGVPKTHAAWVRTHRASFARAIYRVLLAGAVLTPPHLRLLSDAVPGRPLTLRADFPASLVEYAQVQRRDYRHDEEQLTELIRGAAPYLERFGPFNQSAGYEDQHALYAQLVDFMVPDRTGDGPGSHGPDLQEVVRMVAAFHTLELALCNEDGTRANDRCARRFATTNGSHQVEIWEVQGEGEADVNPAAEEELQTAPQGTTVSQPQVSSGPSKKATIFLLGVHKLEEISMPVDPATCAGRLVSLSQPSALDGWPRPTHLTPAGSDGDQAPTAGDAWAAGLEMLRSLDFAELKDRFYGRSGVPNSYPPFEDGVDDGYEQAPPAQVHVFAYALRRRFNRRISATFFDGHDFSYLEFITDAGVFSEAPDVADEEVSDADDNSDKAEQVVDWAYTVDRHFPLVKAEEASFRPILFHPLDYAGYPVVRSLSRWAGW